MLDVEDRGKVAQGLTLLAEECARIADEHGWTEFHIPPNGEMLILKPKLRQFALPTWEGIND